MTATLDHLVIGCQSLDRSRPILEAAFGPTDQGGMHVGRGTHNLLWAMSSPFGPAYIELIAPDPAQPKPEIGPMPFGLHRADRLAQLADGPRLIAWVARTEAAAPLIEACPEDLGTLRPLQRDGLRWQLTIPPDGMGPCEGVVPSLIEWPGGISPAATLPTRGLVLKEFVRKPDPRAEAALSALGLSQILPEGETGGAPMRAVIEGPGGALTLS